MKLSPLPRVTDKYAFRVTETVEELLDRPAVAKQYLPDTRELVSLPEEDPDPIGDEVHSPVKGIVHRYPDRVLFKPANVCAVYCRYCFRREMVGPGSDVLSRAEREAAIDYIAGNPEIWEVILTGGDPLVLSPRQVSEIMAALAAIPHVKVIRFHTRVPIADPGRVNETLIKALEKKPTGRSFSAGPAVYMAVHINHADEITDDVRRALGALHDAGVVLLSQSVLLKGVNDDAAVLARLYRELVALRVKPYYLHHPDFAPGTSHFRVSIEQGQAIMRDLLGRLSGLCQPTYMLDIPGGHGKIPLTPCYIKGLDGDVYDVENYQGEWFSYPPKG